MHITTAPAAVGVVVLLAGVSPFAPARSAADGPDVLPSALAVDLTARTATLPLHQGITPGGAKTWYVITESSDRDDALERGVNAAPKLANALGTRAVQRAHWSQGRLRFSGTVDFSPHHELTPGPDGFPPATAVPGSVADARYSPLVTTGHGIVFNAEQVANASGLHDKVVAINRSTRRVTLRLTEGFTRGDRVLYLSTDASLDVAATLEESTYAPRLDAAPGVADDHTDTSARTGLVAVVNGVTNPRSPHRQGLSSAILGQGDPLNILQWGPTARQYSPLWDVHPAVWTKAAVAAGSRTLLKGFSEVSNGVNDGQIVSGANGPTNPDLRNLRAGGFVVNCPIVVTF